MTQVSSYEEYEVHKYALIKSVHTFVLLFLNLQLNTSSYVAHLRNSTFDLNKWKTQNTSEA